MIWIMLVIATILVCELFLRLPVLPNARRAMRTSARVGRVVSSRAISDHWKERVLPRYSQEIGAASVMLLVLMTVAVSPFGVFGVLGRYTGQPFAQLAASWPGILTATAASLAYFVVRTGYAAAAGVGAATAGKSSRGAGASYSIIDRALHALVLASPAQGRVFLDMERGSAPRPPQEGEGGHHVFVIGLARAGTTALVRAIHGSNAFGSLTYRDMPFVTAPNFWARVTRKDRKEMIAGERAHGDGLDVDFDSPEALEEPFWRSFCGEDYIRADALVPHSVDDETVASYRDFVGHALGRYGKARYLAKNNNGVLRLPALARAFPQAAVLVPFRDPLDQARSLLRQHERFCADGDPFTTRYMRWLVHHEFGRDHRPYVIAGRRPAGSPDGLEYWLSIWVLVYEALLESCESLPLAMAPVCYEDLCRPDRTVWQGICRFIAIADTQPDLRAGPASPAAPVDPELLARAHGLYARLRKLSHRRLGVQDS